MATQTIQKKYEIRSRIDKRYSVLFFILAFFLSFNITFATSVSVSALVAGQCGNGIVEAGEQCDGSSLDNRSCSDFNFASGTLACSGLCSFELTQCTDPAQIDPPPVVVLPPPSQVGSTGGGSAAPFLPSKSSTVVFSGFSEADSTIQLLKDAVVIGQVKTNPNRFFQISTGNLSAGNHVFILNAKDGKQAITESKTFSILVSDNSTVSVSDIYFKSSVPSRIKTDTPKVCQATDFNCDGVVDIKDISLMQYWYKKENPPALVDLNKDKKVDMNDVAILFSEGDKTEKKDSKKSRVYAEFPDSKISSLGIGQTFSVNIMVDPQSDKIYALDSRIKYPSNSLKLKRIEIGKSILGFNFEKPTHSVSNNIGSINLSGAILGGFEGYIKPTSYPQLEPGKIITLVFEALGTGDGDISIGGTVYKIDDVGNVNEEQSEKIPFSIKKYLSYIEDVNKDITPPEFSFVDFDKSGKNMNGMPYVIFKANDDISGVDYYDIYTNGRWASATSPYVFNNSIPNQIKVRAVDLAGNSSIKELILNQKQTLSDDYKKVVQSAVVLFVIGILVLLGKFMMFAL